jgi:hypothetical protein
MLPSKVNPSNMDHIYIILPSDSSGYYFPDNTIADFKQKWLHQWIWNVLNGRLE